MQLSKVRWQIGGSFPANIRMQVAVLWLLVGTWVYSSPVESPGAIDLGTLGVGETLIHRLDYVAGADEAKVREIKPSCSCITVLSYPDTLQPGETETIELKIIGETEGDFRYEIDVFREGVSKPEAFYLDLSVRAAAGKDAAGNSLYVSVKELAPASRVWVDVRSTEAYEKAHIPDSLSIPLYAVKTKSFLRGQDVVLVDEGWGNPIVERTCRNLRKAGFVSVHILRGGLAAWYKAGNPLSGLNTSSEDFVSLRPTDFLSIRNRAKWNIIRVETNFMADEQRLRVVQAVKTARSNESANILILTENGQNDAEMDRQLAALAVPVFYLEGGRKGLEEAMSLMDGKKHGGKQTVTTRPSTQRGRMPQVLRKPCGSCPG